MIVDCALYRDGSRVEGGDDWRALRTRVTEPGDFVWIGMFEPGQDEIKDVAEEFCLHPLAVEDAVVAH